MAELHRRAGDAGRQDVGRGEGGAASGGGVTWFRYVRHEDVAQFVWKGWFPSADLGPTHGVWSVLMQWGGAGEPKE